MDDKKIAPPVINTERLKCCAESLVQAMKLANLYSSNNPGIILAKQNLLVLKNIIKTIDYI